MNQILSGWTVPLFSLTMGHLLCSLCGGFGIQLSGGVQPSQNTENIFSISSGSDSPSSISHLLCFSCQRFRALQLIHPHRVHCLHGCAVSEESGKPPARNRIYQTMAGERDPLICHRYESVTCDKIPKLAAICQSFPRPSAPFSAAAVQSERRGRRCSHSSG